MKPVFGEFEAKVDAKGRFLVPAALIKQLPETERSEFVVNRGLDNCLTLYPLAVWEVKLQEVYAKNQYIEKNRTFARLFQNGATPVSLDNQGRLLLPKKLMDQVGLKSDIVLVGAFDKIEIWPEDVYQNWLNNQENDMAKLSEEIMN